MLRLLQLVASMEMLWKLSKSKRLCWVSWEVKHNRVSVNRHKHACSVCFHNQATVCMQLQQRAQ